MSINVESLCVTPDTNIILYINYTSIKKRKLRKREEKNKVYDLFYLPILHFLGLNISNIKPILVYYIAL